MELTKLKELLGIKPDDTEKDTALEFVIMDISEIIVNYCNVDTIPGGLTSTAYRMAVDLYRAENIGEEAAQQVVSSVSIGGTSTSFSNATDCIKDTVLKNYYTKLNRYRKLVW